MGAHHYRHLPLPFLIALVVCVLVMTRAMPIVELSPDNFNEMTQGEMPMLIKATPFVFVLFLHHPFLQHFPYVFPNSSLPLGAVTARPLPRSSKKSQRCWTAKPWLVRSIGE